MRYVLTTLLFLPAIGMAQSLDAVGACPGVVDITASGLTAGAPSAFLFGIGEGSDVIGAGPCTGTVTGLAGLRLGFRFDSVDGSAAFSPDVPDAACSRAFQILDISTCTLTNVGMFGGDVAPPDGCLGGADLTATAPGGDMVLCDDPTDVTCEEDFGALCPTDWHLCSDTEYNNRNDGWGEPVPADKALGTIYCRGEGPADGAGHFSVSYDGIVSLGDDETINCGYGSSRSTCTSGFGCNEQTSVALCCAPAAACGNGVVDSVEELCDDGNADDADDCLSNCTWRVPSSHGLSGPGC
ncbi:MAG: hypothetical protein ACI8PZ_005149 [Myxococcota bacterium]|jgi:hypothetical protein